MMKPSRRRANHRPRNLTLPELEQCKTSLLNALLSLQSRRSYQHAIVEFIVWYCSELELWDLQLNASRVFNKDTRNQTWVS
jgi:hypothetical protein